MNYQKDIKNTDTNSYGQADVSGSKILINKGIYEYSYKKTEKIVTALYMVTDCMETDDALKSKIRFLGIETLSHIHKLASPYSSPLDNRSSVSLSLINIDEVLSLISMAHTIGFISDMNTKILETELTNLATTLKENQTKDNHFTFTLDEKVFDFPRPVEEIPQKSFTGSSKDFSIGQVSKRTGYDMSFRNTTPLSLAKKPTNQVSNSFSKKDRMDKIVEVIKLKKNIPGNEQGVSIKDISLVFTDCSEKTIQRELNLLVGKGTIKKTGAKRWSRYQAFS